MELDGDDDDDGGGSRVTLSCEKKYIAFTLEQTHRTAL